MPADESPGSETRSSLLLRIRNPSDNEAWAEFHDLYSALLFHYARARGLQDADAEEVRSECLAAVAKQIGEFQYQRSRGSFRSWLRTLVVRRVIDQLRRREDIHADSMMLATLEDQADRPDEIWDRAWRQQHLQYCMMQVKPLVNEITWDIFDSLVEERDTIDELCRRLQVSRNQVYKARSRVLELIRQKMQYLDDDQSANGTSL